MSKRRGATLLELIVVGAVFLALLAALWMIYETTMRVERSVSLKVDADREIFAAVRHVDAALKTARLTQPAEWFLATTTVTALELKPFALGTDGQPLISPDGYPQWGSPYTITFENGELVRVTDQRRRLAWLGPNGYVRFRRPSQGMLEMEIKVEKVGFREQKTSKVLTFQFRLFNQ